MKTQAFYNSINLKGEELHTAQVKNVRQEDKVLSYLRDNPGMSFTAYDIQAAVMGDVLITSIRRSLTNLEKIGVIIKSNRMVIGKYGKPVNCYKAVPEEPYKRFF